MSIVREDLEYIYQNIPVDMLVKKRFLITGGTGFIAKYVIKVLMYIAEKHADNDMRIYVLCRSKAKAEKAFRSDLYSPLLNIIVGDVVEPVIIDESIDYIFHAASISTTPLFHSNPVDVCLANVVGTYNMLELAKKNHIQGLIFFSSGAVYGNIPSGCGDINECRAFPIDSMSVDNCYAESKRMGETMCVSYWKQYHIPIKVVRISHTYGPGINLNDGHIYSDIVKAILNREKLLIKGDGTAVRPYCYISDAVIAIFKIILLGEQGQAYNMANIEETYSVAELVDIILNEVFATRKVVLDMPNRLYNMTDVKTSRINIDKLKNLGWRPKIDIREGFTRTVCSFEEGKDA